MTSLEAIIVDNNELDLRLDKLLCLRFPSYSRTYFQDLIEHGMVLVNGNQIKKREKLQLADEIEICFTLQQELSAEPQNIPLDIIYEDEHIIAINKPINMVVHPAPGHPSNTLVNALLYHCTTLPSQPLSPLRPGIVHRLDKDTSGILLAAKTRQAHSNLVSQFAARTIEKCYLAITAQAPKEGRVHAPIKRDPIQRQKMKVDPLGKEAISDVSIIEKKGEIVLCKVRLITGRTHQIRVHLRHLGCPIIGDPVYGNIATNKYFSISTQMLHAYSIKFLHPMHSTPLELFAPLPKQMQALLESQGCSTM